MNKTRLVCSVVLMLVATCYFCGLTPAASGQQTLFTTQIPAVQNVSDGPTTNYELGTEFTSSSPGYITAIRFWKARSETGQHVGHIWSASGQLLASATFASETASGWQQQPLVSPLAIAANAVYTVSVNTGNTYYAYTTNGLASAVVDQQLSSVVGNNGVSGPPSRFPTTGFYHTNYFRDIVFSPETSQTLFTTQIPAVQNVSDGPTTNYELGTEFTSSAPGYITAIRFWKASSETGQHIGHIWSASGQLLASATFASETASGWQQQPLASPLAIAANAVYTVSVNTGNTYYAYTTNGLATAVVDQPLSSVVGNNGVSGPPSRFPTTGFYHTNYFRDIAFSPSWSPTGPAQSAISVVPASVSFGGVTVGTTNTQTMTVRNQGTVGLSVSQATVSGNGFKFSGLQLPLTVAPGASAAFTVSFAPTTTSSVTGNLTITSNASTSPTTIALSGTGVTATSQLAASPTSLSFGNVNVGSSSSHTVTLTNTGNTSVNVSGDSVTGAGFTTSGLTPLSLGAGQSTTFSVNFAPTATGSVTGSLSVASNATNSSAQITLSGSGVSTSTPAGPLAAFPGAQGGGALSVGGRGGVVYEVTNLNDSGAGSLRACVDASGPRTCVFRVGGTIVINSSLIITNPYITIAGQTAPGGGIQITNSSTCNVITNCDPIRIFTGHDVIIRYIRVRFSPESGTNKSDALGINNPNSSIYNVIFDHVSAAWWEFDGLGLAQTFLTSPIKAVTDFTLQYTILAEGNFSTNGAVAAVVGGCYIYAQICDAMQDLDLHHNFLISNTHRNPNESANRGRLVSNLVYNSSYYQIAAGAHKDFINNYIKDGPYCCRTNPEIMGWPANQVGGGTAGPDFYISGNASTSNGFNPNADQWSGGTTCANCSATNTLTGLVSSPNGPGPNMLNIPLPTTYRRTTPLPVVGAPINNDSALSIAASNGVLLPAYPNSQGNPGVGASAKLSDTACDGSWVANRDSLDTTYVNQFINNTGRSTNLTSPGTLPTIASGTPCISSLHDGIADAWKTKYGLNMTDTTLYQRTAPNGYTYLENYLNGTDPTVAARATSSRSFWAGLTSPKATGGFLHNELPSFRQRNEAVQLFLSPSADFLGRVGGLSLLPYPAANSADIRRRLESRASASLISN